MRKEKSSTLMNKQIFSVYLPVSMVEKLRKMAVKRGTSVNQIILTTIQEALQSEK